MEFEEFHFFHIFRLFLLESGLEDEDWLWEKICNYNLIEREILYRLIYFVFISRKVSWLGNAKYWKALKPIVG